MLQFNYKNIMSFCLDLVGKGTFRLIEIDLMNTWNRRVVLLGFGVRLTKVQVGWDGPIKHELVWFM